MPIYIDIHGVAAATAKKNVIKKLSKKDPDDTLPRARRPIVWLNMVHAGDDDDVHVRLKKYQAKHDASSLAAAKALSEDEDEEEALLRKCKSQPCSPIKLKSCLPLCHKASGKNFETNEKNVREVEQLASNSPSWDTLPSEILQEIFSYLPHKTRMKTSQVCKNWRFGLFHPRFWKKIIFMFTDEDSILWSRFLADCFALSLHEVIIRWDTSITRYIHSIREIYDLLKKLRYNRQLRRLFLEYDYNIYNFSRNNEDDSDYYMPTLLTECLLKIIENSNCLEALSLGCSEQLTTDAYIILEPLRLHHAKHLTHLSLASIKEDPDVYECPDIDTSIFNSFIRLTFLTLDYDYVNDTLLRALNSGCMKRLVIHVHKWKDVYRKTTNRAWRAFVKKNPSCELRLNLIHCYEGVKVMDTDLLCPAMPLTHLKVLFSESVNPKALGNISMWYSNTLRSLTWIDSLDTTQHMPPTFDHNEPDSPDGLVLVAWKCTKLKRLVFVGHKYYQENILAIARLRGSTLKLLVFAKSDITLEHESWHHSDRITHEIKQILGTSWMPFSDSDLPMVILDPFQGDSREVILPLVLSDQK